MCLLDAVTWVTEECMDVIVGPETRICYVFHARTRYMSQLNQGKMVSDPKVGLGLYIYFAYF